MSRASPDATLPEMESLFAIERELVPEAEELRHRVLQRARASLPRIQHLPLEPAVPARRGIRIGVAAAAIVLLPALCAAAFYAGYQTRSRNAPPAVEQTPTASVASPVVPASSVVVALVPVDSSMGSLFESAETSRHDAGGGRAKPAVSAKAAIEIEAYALELQVLQPARQAVAQGDFARALLAMAEHQRRFPSGKLAEEREALRVKALLGLGRTAEAQRAGAAFRARFPRSALLGRIEQMLGTQK